MKTLDTPKALMDHVGATDMGNLNSAPNQAYPLTFYFNGVAAGGLIQCQPEKLPSDAAFVAEQVIGSVWLTNAGGGGALAGTELPDGSSPTDASNTLPSTTLITVNLRSSQFQFARQDIPWSLIIGTRRNPLTLLHQLVFSPGSEVRFTGTNGTTVTISGVVTLLGHFVKR